MAEILVVDVTYATATQQDVVRLQLAPGSTVEQALRASGLLARHPDIDLAQAAIGIFGKLAQLATPLTDQDRVEIYRPLLTDPKEARRRRARKKK